MLDISGYFRPLIFDGFGTPTNQTSKQNTRENSYDPNFSKPLDPSNIGAFDSRASISSSNSTQAQIAASLSDRQFSSRYPGKSTARMAQFTLPSFFRRAKRAGSSWRSQGSSCNSSHARAKCCAASLGRLSRSRHSPISSWV